MSLLVTALLLLENQKLRNQLNTDSLTLLKSRHAYQNRRHIEGQVYIVIDVDKFKQINDTYGHQVGDQVLAAIAACIREETDSAYRTGGDEFVAVVNTDIEGARAIAQRIKESVSKLEIGGVLCSVSIGVGYTEDDADRDMYTNKRV